jgi:hypothetical protein
MRGSVFFIGLVSWAVSLPLAAQQSVEDIYRRVAVTFQLKDSRRPPSLIVQSSTRGSGARGAWFDPEGERIVIEQSLIDHFRADANLGDDAIAFVLAHELGHFYGDHGLLFTAASAGVTSTAQLEALKGMEAEADHKALLHSHLAGFRGALAGPAAIRALYGLYGLKPELPGYPSLEARTTVTEEIIQNLRPLLPLYPLGMALVLNSHLEEAALIFEYLSAKFRSPDFEHNAAVLQAKIGLAGIPSAAGYAQLYPFIFATDNNLERSVRGARGEREGALALLHSAEQRLQRLLRIAPKDAAVRINLALVLDLLERRKEGLSLLEENQLFQGGFALPRDAARMILWHHSGATVRARQAAVRQSAKDRAVWDAFFRNIPAPRPASRLQLRGCPELTFLVQRMNAALSDSSLAARKIKGLGRIPGDPYDLGVEVTQASGVTLVSLRSHQISLRLISLDELTEPEVAGLSAYFAQFPSTGTLLGSPMTFRHYRTEVCHFVLEALSGKVQRVYLLEQGQ